MENAFKCVVVVVVASYPSHIMGSTKYSEGDFFMYTDRACMFHLNSCARNWNASTLKEYYSTEFIQKKQAAQSRILGEPQILYNIV